MLLDLFDVYYFLQNNFSIYLNKDRHFINYFEVKDYLFKHQKFDELY
jgi:hypothetical protein